MLEITKAIYKIQRLSTSKSSRITYQNTDDTLREKIRISLLAGQCHKSKTTLEVSMDGTKLNPIASHTKLSITTADKDTKVIYPKHGMWQLLS